MVSKVEIIILKVGLLPHVALYVNTGRPKYHIERPTYLSLPSPNFALTCAVTVRPKLHMKLRNLQSCFQDFCE